MLSDKFEKAVISKQPATIISNNKKLEQYLAERVDKWLSEMALDKSLQGISIIRSARSLGQ
jgi:hypothetical protein